MSVLIKDMEMPTSEEKCKFFQPAPFRAPFCVINGVCHGIDACPLIEVATPHGKLINADVLDILCKREQQAWQDYEHNPDNEYLEGVKDGLHEASKLLSTAITIIEVEACKEKGE